VQYVGATRELWVTTPRESSLTVLDASTPGTLKPKTVIRTPGSPEGFAVDEAHGLFFTNLEDKNQTLSIDVKTHTIKSTWSPGCGADGPRGVAVDDAAQRVLVACTDRIQVLDGQHAGTPPLFSLETGVGVDNIDWDPHQRALYVGAARAATLTVVGILLDGQPRVLGTFPTAQGARNAVTDQNGSVYLADPAHGALLIVPIRP
jgi:DNA-binding beta-propeller fold protein YncE